MPGVSGAILSISFGIYEKILYIISHPLKLKKRDLYFLICLTLGASLGIITLCDLIKWCLNNYYFITISIFLGLIVGGIPEITSKTKITKTNFILLIISILLTLILTNLNTYNISKNIFLMGSIESLTTIIPGISGTAIFMALGWYEELLITIKNILTFNSNFSATFSFITGFLLTTFVISYILTVIFKKYEKQSYTCILGFVTASLLQMINKLLAYFNYINFILGLILFLVGYFITIKINNIFKPNKHNIL